MPLQFGVFILLKIFRSWNQFKDVLHAGSVVAGGILLLETGLNPLTHVCISLSGLPSTLGDPSVLLA